MCSRKNVCCVSQHSLKIMKETGHYTRRAWHGCQTAWTQQHDRCLFLCVRRNKRSTAKALQNDLQQAFGVNVCDQTVRNRSQWRCHQGPTSSQPSTVQLEWHPSSLHRWAGSHWAHVTDMKESRDAVVNFTVPVTSNVNGLVVGKWSFGGGPGFFLLQDNVWSLVAKVSKQSLDNEGIVAIDWPSCSPDLNPFEHLWAQFNYTM